MIGASDQPWRRFGGGRGGGVVVNHKVCKYMKFIVKL